MSGQIPDCRIRWHLFLHCGWNPLCQRSECCCTSSTVMMVDWSTSTNLWRFDVVCIFQPLLDDNLVTIWLRLQKLCAVLMIIRFKRKPTIVCQSPGDARPARKTQDAIINNRHISKYAKSVCQFPPNPLQKVTSATKIQKHNWC